MWKFIFKCFSFLLVGAVIYPLFLVGWGIIMPVQFKSNLINTPLLGFTSEKLAELRRVSQPDILFLGSSHAYRSFDPRIFQQSGYRIFNLGTSQQTAVVTNWLVDRYMDRIKPGLVVYVVDQGMLTSSGVESAVDIMLNDSMGLDMLRLLSDVNHINLLNAGIYHLAWDILPLSKSHMIQKFNNKEKYISAGYSIYLKDSSKNKFVIQKNKLALSKVNIFKFQKIILNLKKRGISYILVTTPFTKDYALKRRSSALFNFADYGPYTDFNDEIKLDDNTHFYDAHHLNQKGVNEFNRYFIRWMEDNRIIPLKGKK